MLRKMINHCRVELHIEALEPLLVKSGSTVISGPDMAFVRTSRGGEVEPFIPGSSLKGVLRSHAERIARTLSPGSVCDVFDKARIPGCSTRRVNDIQKAASDYDLLCPACQLFGSLAWKGRFHIGDAYLTTPANPEIRDGIGIDRVSGGVASGAKFDMEVLPAGVTFTTVLEIENYQMWQLGWMAYVLRDLLEGHIRVGSGTSRGLGRLQGSLDSVSLSYIGTSSQREMLNEQIPGIGMFLTDTERKMYGIEENDFVAKPAGFDFERPAGSIRTALEETSSDRQMQLLTALAGAWDPFIVKQTSLVEA